jgi:hypothetical protein
MLPGNSLAGDAAFASSKKEPLEHERVVELKLFISPKAHDRLLAAYQHQGLIEKQSTMVSYYFDAFESGRFVLQNRPDGGAKFRFRVKEREGKAPKLVLQTKSRFQATAFPIEAGLPFSARFTEELSQDADQRDVASLKTRAEAAAESFKAGVTPTEFAVAAREAGQTFVKVPGEFLQTFDKALDEAGGKAKDVVFAGALWNVRHQAEDQTTPEGTSYEFEFDAYQLAIAPGKMATEHAVEADFEPGATPADTQARLKQVLADVARRLKALGLRPEDTLPPQSALSDPLGPNGGYMGPIAKVLSQARRR